MLETLTTISTTIGSALAIGAKEFPSHRDSLETCAGALLIIGLALLGSVLPHL